MKIAVFHNLPAGGAKRFLYEELRFLSQEHAVDLFKLRLTDESFLDIRPFCDDVFEYEFNLNSALPGFLSRLEYDYRTLVQLQNVHKKIAKDIDKKNYDVVLVQPDRLTESPFVLKYCQTPTLYYSQELLRIAYEDILKPRENLAFHKKIYENSIRKVRKSIDRQNARSSDVIVTSSEYMLKNIKKAYQRKAVICYPGVDTDVFKNTKKTKNKVLYMGNKDDIDGYPLLKKIEETLADQIEVVMLKFNDGGVDINDDTRLAELYSEAMVTLCLDHGEPFGLKATESMACETPVLAVKDGGYKETVIDGKTGYLLPREVERFTNKLIYLIKHPDVVDKMGKAGRVHVKKNFTWGRHNKKLEKLLSETANKRK